MCICLSSSVPAFCRYPDLEQQEGAMQAHWSFRLPVWAAVLARARAVWVAKSFQCWFISVTS